MQQNGQNAILLVTCEQLQGNASPAWGSKPWHTPTASKGVQVHQLCTSSEHDKSVSMFGMPASVPTCSCRVLYIINCCEGVWQQPCAAHLPSWNVMRQSRYVFVAVLQATGRWHGIACKF